VSEGAALFRKIDCVRLAVDDLDEAIGYYSRLGHELVWRRPTQAGLRLSDTDTELVVQTEEQESPEIDVLVDDADAAAERFAAAGGRVVAEPFDIEVGRCVVVEDPWGNRLVLLDLRRGPLPELGSDREV
jgi:catechol 2,3-dioxygenase-like lactoylglutathione lyase family enzyme